MKALFPITLFCFIFFSSCQNYGHREEVETADGELRGTISISGAFALYPVTVVWAEEFRKQHPKVRIDISAGGAGKGMTDALTHLVDIGMVSREIHTEEIRKGAWYVPVAKDAVLPVMSANHPQLNEVLTKGLKQKDFENIFVTNRIKKWSEMGINSTLPVHGYTRSDAAGAAESWAHYLGVKQEDLQGIGVFGDPGISQAVMKDVSAIGYNNIVYAYDSKTKMPLKGIRPVSIDLNENGVIDAEENFYNSLDELMQAIAENKFPSPPARELFFVTGGKPERRVVKEFIRFVLTEGQKHVKSSGYVNLPQSRIDSLTVQIQ